MLAALTFNTAENLPVGLLALISDDLHVSLSAVGLLVTGYGVTVAVASVPIAYVVRAVPRRYVLTGLLAALVVSSLVAALAVSYGQLLGARLVTALAQALFWAVMGPVAVGLFAPEVRGRVVGALVLPLTGVRGTFLAGGLLTVGSCAVLLGGRLLCGYRQTPERACTRRP